MLEITVNGKSLSIKSCSTLNFPINALIPTTHKILKMLLPTTLPNEIALLPANEEVIETAASGALVPKATMVSPTTSVDIL